MGLHSTSTGAMAGSGEDERKPLMEEEGAGKAGKRAGPAKMEYCSSDASCGDVELGEGGVKRGGGHAHSAGGHCCNHGDRGGGGAGWRPYQHDPVLYRKLVALNLVSFALALAVVVRAFMVGGLYWGIGVAVAVWFAIIIISRLVRVQLVKMGVIHSA